MPSQPGPQAGARSGQQPVRIAIDLETTGLNAETDAIIEVAAIKFSGDTVLDTLESLVAPNAGLPYRIQRLTGITPAALRRAPALGSVLGRLRVFIGDAPLVGHNVAFDAGFLRRAGIATRNPLLDTYELSSMLLPTLSSYTLTSVGGALDLHSDERHRALADADLSRRVFLALLARLGELDVGALEELLALPAGRDWTPAYLLRQELRSRRDARTANSFGGVLTTSLRDQLASKLGVDTGVLSLAGPSTAQAPTAVAAALTPDSQHSDVRSQAVAVRMAPVLRDGGVLLMEIEHDVSGLVACVEPGLRWALETGGRLVIAASDADALRRLMRDVIPVARARLHAPNTESGSRNGSSETLRIAELAQRESYLCLWRWFGVARGQNGMPVAPDETRGLSKLVVWARATPSGMRADVALSGQEQRAWERVRAGRELADSAAACPYGKGGYCFLSAAQDGAAAAQVVVTTHAALAARLAGVDDLLTEAGRTLILDAHQFEETLRDTHAGVVDRTRLRELLAALGEMGSAGRAGLLHLAALQLQNAAGRADAQGSTQGGSERVSFDQIAAARRCVEAFFAALQTVMARADSGGKAAGGASFENPEQRVLRIDAGLRRSSAWQGAERTWRELVTHLTTVAATAREAARRVTTAERRNPGSGSGVPLELLGVARQIEAVVAAGSHVFDGERDDAGGAVSWLRMPYPNATDRGVRGLTDGRARGSQPNAHSTPAAHARRDGRSDGRSPDRAQPDAEPPKADVLPDVQGDDTSTLTEKATAVGDAVGAAGDTPARDDVPVLHSARVMVGDLLAPLMNDGHGVILASPVLSVAGDFEYMRGTLKLPESVGVASLVADRAEQTLLCLPTDVPEPNAPRFQRSLEETLIALAAALDGRLVALFPSHAALRSAYNGIRRALEAKNILVLGQGQDGSARQLWQTFATEPRVVLLGAGAFWDGSMLRRHPPACVVVTRLPFPAMSDPLLAARADIWDDPQSQFVVPQAALKLRQALSGLAWNHEERNAVVLFDRRVQTRGYGPTIIGSLPRCSQHEEPVEALTERIAEWVGPA